MISTPMRIVGLFLLLAAACSHLLAHQIAEMPIDLQIHGTQVSGIIEADAAYMLPGLRGDEDEEPKDLAWLRQLGPAGWEEIERESDKYWHECLQLEADGAPLPWNLKIPAFHEDPAPFMNEGEAEELPMLEIHLEAELPPGASKLEAIWREPFGVVLIVTTGEGSSAEVLPMVSGERAVVAERSPEQPEMRPKESSPGYWIKLGFVHILPLGIDHILFVLGLFLLAPKWKPLLQQTITFTVAHSVSLAAAVLGWVTLPANPVEILIAASIAWVGAENLWVKELGKGRLLLVGAFGLIHGLGFASVLAELLPVDRPDQLPVALLGFNVGVECGQIAVLAAAFVCFGWLGERFRVVKRAGSIVIAVAGLLMVVERLVGIDFLPGL
ncbi:HupE/UreJ family protein [Luteolibacter marinus]|uniref:HupE/UreJ family protein n=1 Tax=Luteolibacter marinus TaxID=2776705 RepID=UPI001865D08E|nr:HupE/UreJ family protein [Luteolibacter marinus]